MVPSERVDAIDNHSSGANISGGGGSGGVTTNHVSSNTSHDNSNVAGGCPTTVGGSNNGNSVHSRTPDVEPGDPKGPPTRQECSKLVYGLSREVAVYCCISMSLGGVSDSYVLRDELKSTGNKTYELALLCKRRLMPLLMSKRLKDEEREDVERLYRIFAGCVEMLQSEFVRAITLQAIFPLWDSSTLLIQTGISEGLLHRKLCTNLESLDVTDLQRKMMDREEAMNVEKKVATLQEMLYSTSQLMDVQPWDCKPDTDHTKIDVETSDAEQEGSDVAEGETHVNTGSPRHRKCIWILVLVLGCMVVVAGVLGLALALNKSDSSDD
ncbi:regulator of G-protein signaling 9-binding protein [Aplysia californica]|uniref:Regulator of G-protein signaling 9-binding protein n=1 Tax=Aplysia californica TaxID=6500 RepID=A0ABM0ZWH5_APLCA|nr:regulator of G-protein signaling 9-binding protein [Aplysia californica]XP_012935957.1 regulator of G-protein signaling 9-binding protein [Aplysia californica]